MAIKKVYEDLCSYLRSLNFHFLKTWVIECVDFYNSQNPNISFETLKSEIKQQWLLVNLRDIKVPSLPPDLVSCPKTILRGTYAVQVETMIDSSQSCYCQFQKLRNVCTENIEHTKNEYNNEPRVTPKRCLTFSISDGVQELQAMEYQPITKIRTNDPELLPGFKMLIIGPVECRKGMILLKDENVQICGGEVDTLTTTNSLRSILMKRLNLNEDDCPENEPNTVLENNKPDSNSVPLSVGSTPVPSTSSVRSVQSSSGFESLPSTSSVRSVQSSSGFESLPSTSSVRSVQSSSGFESLPSTSSVRSVQSSSGFESLPSTSSSRSIQSSSGFESLPSTSCSRSVQSSFGFESFPSTSSSRSVQSVSSFDSFPSTSSFRSVPSTSKFGPVPSVSRSNENVEALLSQNDDLFLSLPLETVSLEENLNNSKNIITNSNSVPLSTNHVSEIDTKNLTRDNIFDDILSFVMNKKHSLPEEDNNASNKKRISLDSELINENGSLPRQESATQSSMIDTRTDEIIIPDDDWESQIQNTEANSSHWNVKSIKKPVQTTLTSFFSKRDSVSFTLDDFDETQDTKPEEIKPVVVSNEPFVYLKNILSVNLKKPSVFKIKAIILTLTKKITVENDEYNLRATITDGSLSVEASFSSTILEDFLGFSPCEMTVMMRAKQTNSAIDQRLKEAFSRTQQKLISLNCLMEIKFYPNGRIPEILSLEEINMQHLISLRERLLKKL